MSNTNILPATAARVLGVSPQFIRIGLQQGRLPFGSAVKFKNKYSYHISPALLAEYMGMDINELKKEVQG